jgi:hypothetical protein
MRSSHFQQARTQINQKGAKFIHYSTLDTDQQIMLHVERDYFYCYQRNSHLATTI